MSLLAAVLAVCAVCTAALPAWNPIIQGTIIKDPIGEVFAVGF